MRTTVCCSSTPNGKRCCARWIHGISTAKQKHFDSRIEAIVPTAGRLYDRRTGVEDSLLHAPGTSNTPGASATATGTTPCQAQAVVAAGLVFSRGQERYRKPLPGSGRNACELPAGNPATRRSAAVGAVNNNFATHCMRPDGSGTPVADGLQPAENPRAGYFCGSGDGERCRPRPAGTGSFTRLRSHGTGRNSRTLLCYGRERHPYIRPGRWELEQKPAGNRRTCLFRSPHKHSGH